MKKRYKYKLPLIEDAEGGIASLVMAGISLLLFVLSALISFLMSGKAGVFIGAFGISGILLSAAGFLTGLRSFQEIGKSHRFGTIGSLFGGILAVFWLGLLLAGIS